MERPRITSSLSIPIQVALQGRKGSDFGAGTTLPLVRPVYRPVGGKATAQPWHMNMLAPNLWTLRLRIEGYRTLSMASSVLSSATLIGHVCGTESNESPPPVIRNHTSWCYQRLTGYTFFCCDGRRLNVSFFLSDCKRIGRISNY